MCFYEDKYRELVKGNVTAVFAVSDFYALEFMRFIQGKRHTNSKGYPDNRF